MPYFLNGWTRAGLGGHDVVVFYLCSQVVEKRFVMGRQRAEENEALLDRLAALGVPAEHIFIVGHSGGASSALLTSERAPEKFNAAIVSAPGYGYAWMEAEGDSYLWMDTEYDKWRRRLANAPDMQALVYVYDGDIISPPKDALFLRDHPGVEVVVIPPVDETGALCTDDEQPHFYWWTSCFRNQHEKTVEDYIVSRLSRS
jgi:pimeloyl-ACP methyl ester carboxylesterase